MNLKKLLLIGLLLVILLVAALPFLFDRFIVASYLSEWKTQHVTPIAEKTYIYLPEFKKDLEILKPKLDFLNANRVKDAGPFLNPRISWDFAKGETSKSQEWESKVDKSQLFSIPENVRTLIKNFKGNLLEADPKEFSQVNTEWLHKLRGFDYWEIDKNSPLDLYPRVSLTTPFPNFNIDFIKIHLVKAKGLSETEYIESIQDVLHYGRLCFSTETLIGEMIFVSTIGWAKSAADARTGVREKLGPWTNLLDEKDRLKRVFWSMNQFARPVIGTNIETMKEIYNEQQFSTGICAVVREATAIDWPIWSAASDAMPAEFDEYRRLIMDHPNGCHFTWIKDKTPAWVKLPNEPDSLYSSGQAFSFTNVVSGVEGNKSILNTINLLARFIHIMPNTRKFVGTILATIATPTYIKGYEDATSVVPEKIDLTQIDTSGRLPEGKWIVTGYTCSNQKMVSNQKYLESWTTNLRAKTTYEFKDGFRIEDNDFFEEDMKTLTCHYFIKSKLTKKNSTDWLLHGIESVGNNSNLICSKNPARADRIVKFLKSDNPEKIKFIYDAEGSKAVCEEGGTLVHTITKQKD